MKMAVVDKKWVMREFEIEIPTYYKKQLAREANRLDTSFDSLQPKPRILNNMFYSPDGSSALDRINLSDTKFTILEAAIVKADGQNLDDGPLSCSMVY